MDAASSSFSTPNPVHQTQLGTYHCTDVTTWLTTPAADDLCGKVQLILTSPPFPLNEKKAYGNHTGQDYYDWFVNLAPRFAELLAPDGSLVIEMGNAWEGERPVQSLLHLEALLAFVKHPEADLRLCQQFICHNPARLPSPAQWVTVTRSRVTDSFTHLWWMSRTDTPKADNRKVLRPYSKSMRNLLKRQRFNAGTRPSGHHISPAGFLTDHQGSIPPNVIEIDPIDDHRDVRLPFPVNTFSIANTASNDFFLKTCRARGITPHPARMPTGLAAFFIQFLTDPDDLVLDPFAGSNTTGFVAECLERRWLALEIDPTYAEQSKIRFEDPILRPSGASPYESHEHY